jgi:uncharacterized protein (TIRG00374 family)
MTGDTGKIFKTLNPNKIWIPVLFGLGIVAYLFYSDPSVSSENLALIRHARPGMLSLALLMIVVRAVFYILRIKVIAREHLDWTSSVYVIMLWEFASAVTPSVVGGTAVAVFILMKEGVSLGKSLALVMLTAIMDNLIFVVFAPVVFFFADGQIIPQSNSPLSFLGWSFSPQSGLQVLFWISYLLIGLYTLVMCYALFIKPRAFKWLLLKITSLKFLRRWRYRAYEHGNEVIWASSQLKGKRMAFWITITVVTILIWSVRYLQLNFIIASLVDLPFSDHRLIFARQLILWIIMLVSPTPGSSGAAEFFFPLFFEDYLGAYTLISNILWRALSFYPYLLLGAIFLPRWLRRVFFNQKLKSAQ